MTHDFVEQMLEASYYYSELKKRPLTETEYKAYLKAKSKASKLINSISLGAHEC